MIKPQICILDYGSGNVKSVLNLMHHLSLDACVSNDEGVVESATHLILPGVGAFAASMEKIRAKLPLALLEKRVFRDRIPFLGICVGMQVLAEKGREFGDHTGLGWLGGSVEKLECGDMPLPHMGWNDVRPRRPSPLLRGLEEPQDFYFLHSYAFANADDSQVLATASYGAEFPCVVAKGNIFGVQFHPEKSQRAGMIMMKNFAGMA